LNLGALLMDDKLNCMSGRFRYLEVTGFTSYVIIRVQEEISREPQDPNAFEGPVVVFDRPEDYLKRIEDVSTPIDDTTILIMRGTGPLGYPGYHAAPIESNTVERRGYSILL